MQEINSSCNKIDKKIEKKNVIGAVIVGDSQTKNERLEQLRRHMYISYSKRKDEKEIVEISQELDKLIYEFISMPSKNRLTV